MSFIIGYGDWCRLYEATESVKAVSIESALSGYGITADNFEQKVDFDLESTVDIVIDVLAGALDGMPGIGTGASTAVDLLHTLSYAVRCYYSETDAAKAEYLALSVINGFGAFIPAGGNTQNIAARLGIANILKISPMAVSKLIAHRSSALKRYAMLTKWKFDALWILVRLVGSGIGSLFVSVADQFRDLARRVEAHLKGYLGSSIGWLIQRVITALKELVSTFSDMRGLVVDMIALSAEVGA